MALPAVIRRTIVFSLLQVREIAAAFKGSGAGWLEVGRRAPGAERHAPPRQPERHLPLHAARAVAAGRRHVLRRRHFRLCLATMRA